MTGSRRAPKRPVIDWQERRREIADNALPLYLERPWPNVSIEDVARESEMSFWQVYYSFDGQEDVYRAAVMRLFDKLSNAFAGQKEPDETILQTIRTFVDHVAAIVQTADYRNLLYLRVRDEPTERWLGIYYERKIVQPLMHGLHQAIATSGQRQGMEIGVDEPICRRSFASLEASLSLPGLLQRNGLDEEFCEEAIRNSSKRIWAGTYQLDESLRVAV